MEKGLQNKVHGVIDRGAKINKQGSTKQMRGWDPGLSSGELAFEAQQKQTSKETERKKEKAVQGSIKGGSIRRTASVERKRKEREEGIQDKV